MAAARRVIGTALLVATLALPAACRRAAPPAPPREELEHFDGVIDHGRTTNDPVRSDLYVRAARALEAGDAKAAEALYREAVAKYPADPDGYEALGTCLSFQGHHDEARAEYERALRLAPGSRDALYGLGCVAYHERRYPEAVGHLEAVLAARPADAPAHRVLAFVYDDLGDGPKALAHYTRAAELDPRTAAEEHVRRRIDALKNGESGPR